MITMSTINFACILMPHSFIFLAQLWSSFTTQESYKHFKLRSPFSFTPFTTTIFHFFKTNLFAFFTSIVGEGNCLFMGVKFLLSSLVSTHRMVYLWRVTNNEWTQKMFSSCVKTHAILIFFEKILTRIATFI